MNLIIEERKFSLRSEYDISAPGVSYYAERKLFSLRPKLTLFSEDRQALARIEGRWFSLRSKFGFLFSDGKIYHFWCEKIWKGVFDCEGNGQKLVLYTHRGVNYSIFQADRQIAALTKNRVVVGKGNRYDVRVDRGANLPLIVCMILVLNTAENDDNRETVTFDVGNIGPQERPFDKNWEPS